MRWLLALALLHAAHAANQGYYGKFIGKLSQLHHGVSGDVYAVDARTLHIRDFTYDGEGPAAWFYAGNSKNPSSSTGFKVPDERGTLNVLRRYRGEHITLTLPDNKTLRDIKWISVYCDQYSVNFGDVKINKNLDFPKPQKIDGLSPHAGGHLVSSDNIVIVDAQTLLVPNFSYDGEAPDAKFWVGPGPKPSSQGIRVPDENGKEVPLRRYDRKTIVLTLPGALTVQDIGHFGVWCEAFAVDFGHVRVPRPLNVPPSLKMLNVSAQKRPRSLQQFRSQLQQLQPNTFTDGFDYYNNAQTNPRAPVSGSPASVNAAFQQQQQQIRATTYKPSFARSPVHSDSSFQIIPSISLTPDDLRAGQQAHFDPSQAFFVSRRSDNFHNYNTNPRNFDRQFH